jgi:integrase
MARPRTTNKHLPRYVTIIHGSYWYRPPNAKPLKLARVGDESTMYRRMADLLIPTEAAQPTGTLADYFDRYEREIVPTLAPRTQKDYHRHLQVLRREFGHRKPDELQPRDVGRFLDVQTGKIHRVRIVAVLSAVYTKMVGKWYVAEKNPCLTVERHKNEPRSRYITDEEFWAVHALMPVRLKLAMELALYTGQRQGDLLSLTWDDVLEDGVLFNQSKTGQSRLVLYVDPDSGEAVRKEDSALWDVLSRAKKIIPMIPRKYVLRTEEGKRFTSEGFRSLWQRYMKRAANGYSKKPKKGAEAVKYPPIIKERFTFHDIRAKTVSDEENVDIAQLRAGHTNKAMTLRVYSRKTRKVVALSKKQAL